MNIWNTLRRISRRMKASSHSTDWTFVYHIPAGSIDIYGRPIGGRPGHYYQRYVAESGKCEYRHATPQEALDEERASAW